MKFLSWLLILGVFPLSIKAQAYKNLPEWAVSVFESSRQVPKPIEAAAWVLLDRTELAYAGDGEIRIHRFRLVEILNRNGLGEGTFIAAGLSGSASRIKKIKGWNLRPDGDLVKLDRDDVLTLDNPGSSWGVSNQRLTGAKLDRVESGSVIAFESIQVITDPGGPSTQIGVMEQHPIFQWEIKASTQSGWFGSLKNVTLEVTPCHFNPWIPSPKIMPNVGVSADNLPPIPKAEMAVPQAWCVLPRVSIRYIDPNLKNRPPTGSWDGIAAWTETTFAEKAAPYSPLPHPAPIGLEGLRAIHLWMRTHLTYKQVYLTPERGLIPLSAPEVARHRYGDCKDLASCFIAAVRTAGFEVFPVLARIPHERIEPEEPINFASFNHVIVAIRLEETLHLDSEVQTLGGRFLLVDPTARFTPLGKLPNGHENGRLLICAGGKGLWTEIPATALEDPKMEVALLGKAELGGSLKGTIQLREWGNTRNLRSSALGMNPAEYQQFVFSQVLALPVNSSIRILNHSDALDLERPFELSMNIEDPKGFEIHGSEWDLSALGIFRVIPPIIQKSGQSRKFPIQTFGRETLDAHAEIVVPAPLKPTLFQRAGSTAFHEFSWEASSQIADGGDTKLLLHFKDSDKPTRFWFESKDRGLQEWVKDRRMMQDFIAEALSFELKP